MNELGKYILTQAWIALRLAIGIYAVVLGGAWAMFYFTGG